MEMIYPRELGMSVVPDEVSNANQTKLSFSDALTLYQWLKGTGKSNLFFKVSTRSIRYLQECLGHNKIVNLKPADAGLFTDFLFNRGMAPSFLRMTRGRSDYLFLVMSSNRHKRNAETLMMNQDG